jgi:ubiquitin carboxyl-terminal hydrolase 25
VLDVAKSLQIADNKNLEDQAVQAVRIIARERKSEFLTDWIATGFSTGAQNAMDIAEAYRVLGVQNREVDDEMISVVYNTRILDNPANANHFNLAVTTIGRDRNSAQLLSLAQNDAPIDPQGALEEPVGLENIGNTCYLNSLLQFLFTMHELRRLVLDFEHYKMSLDAKSMENKQVGRRKVSIKEVQSAQKFVAGLASLFLGMIQTPQSSIKPEQELARLTLETESVKEKMRRRSTLKSNERPSLGAIDDLPVLGPLPQADYAENGITDADAVLSPLDDTPDPLSTLNIAKNDAEAGENVLDDASMNDNSSEITLVSKPDSEQNAGEPAPQQERVTADDKENVSPTKPPTMQMAVSPWTGLPMKPTESSILNAQSSEASKDNNQAAGIDPALMRFAPPAGKPPPVPPRKPVQNPSTTLEEYARQQDVTEVLNHCIIQMSYALRPTGVDKSGEQLDEVHDLFFGQQVEHSQPQKEPPKPVPFLNIITRVFQRPADVYAAIENEYDLQDAQNGTKTYTSITSLPPVFSIALDRVAWNNETKRQEKLNDHVDVPETIFLDRFLEGDPDSDLLQRRQQTWEMKKELALLTARRDELEEKHVRTCATNVDPPLTSDRQSRLMCQVSSRTQGLHWSISLKSLLIISPMVST